VEERVTIQQEPVPGNYYINLTGQLIRVKMILYSGLDASRVVIEYLDGRRIHIDIQEWDWLDLSVYPDWLNRQRDNIDLEYEL
jgi:hypothetical protein